MEDASDSDDEHTAEHSSNAVNLEQILRDDSDDDEEAVDDSLESKGGDSSGGTPREKSEVQGGVKNVVTTNPTLTGTPHAAFQLTRREKAPLSDRALRFELLPGLWVELSSDANIRKPCPPNGHYEELIVRANVAAFENLGHRVFVAEGVRLQAKVSLTTSGEGEGEAGKRVIQNLFVAMDGIAVDPLADRTQLQAFQDRFGCHNKARAKKKVPDLQPGPLSQEQWDALLLNALEDTQTPLAVIPAPSAEDISTPFAIVKAVQCFLPGGKHALGFPDCQGSEGCTLRSLLQFYTDKIIDKMDLLSGHKAEMDVGSDLRSFGGSIMGASVGGLVLGPVGFVAGSFVGGQMGRKACEDPTLQDDATIISETGSCSLTDAASDHVHKNKYQYSGSAGVVAGALAGSTFGPVGTVVGAAAGAASSRKLMEGATSVVSCGKEARGAKHTQSYRFGDFSRGVDSLTGGGGRRVVSRGKEARGAEATEQYLFGDFTRGVVSHGKEARGAEVKEGYRFGDFSRGLDTFMGGGGRQVVSRGKEARGADTAERYRFGDFSRGIVARGKEARGAKAKEGYQFGDFTRGLFS